MLSAPKFKIKYNVDKKLLIIIASILIGILLLAVLCILFIPNDHFENLSPNKIFKAPMSLTKLKSSPSPNKISTINAKLGSFDEIVKIVNMVEPSSSTFEGNVISFPSFFYANEKWPGCVPRALYQGSCGSCFGFAAVTALSSRFYIESCGLSGCTNYPQINFGSLNNVYNNINDIYKFRKVYLTDIFKYIDLDKNNKITLDEWLTVIQKYYDTYNSNGSPLSEKYYVAQVLVYILNFQSLGSLDLANKIKVMERAKQAFQIWLDVLNYDFNKFNSKNVKNYVNEEKKDFVVEEDIDITKLVKVWDNEPVGLSAEKIIACCTKCMELDFNKSEKMQSLACVGGTLADAWSMLKESGTPTAMCVGYNLDGWTEGEPAPSCKDIQGPFYSFCSGYALSRSIYNLGKRGQTDKTVDEKASDWTDDVNEIINKYEDSGINPAAIPANDKDVMWVDPQIFRFKAKNVYEIPNNMKGIQREILERGPVTTGFTMYPDFQYSFGTDGLGGQKYKEGSIPLGASRNSLIYMHTPSPTDEKDQLGGHAIVLCGWGVFNYEEGGRVVGIPYWICLNSWGTEFGTSGFPSYANRNSTPVNMKSGGYFWMIRGLNNCGIEENAIAGQPDLENISYTGTIDKYGWGAPSPSEKDVKYIRQVTEPVKIGPNDVLTFERTVEGGGSYSNREQVGENADGPIYKWELASMNPPSPYVLFWPNARPIYCIGTITGSMDSLTINDSVEIDDLAVDCLKKIVMIQNNPLLVIGDEQLQMIKVIGNNMFVNRAVNNSIIEKHNIGDQIKVIPFKTLNVPFLEKIGTKC